MRRKGWLADEEQLLIENYHTKTINELVDMFKGMNRKREADSINAKIKRLKADGKIVGGKTEETVQRSLIQRRR